MRAHLWEHWRAELILRFPAKAVCRVLGGGCVANGYGLRGRELRLKTHRKLFRAHVANPADAPHAQTNIARTCMHRPTYAPPHACLCGRAFSARLDAQ
eukprot:15039011-Alexandrium_andersonii.AAC.1